MWQIGKRGMGTKTEAKEQGRVGGAKQRQEGDGRADGGHAGGMCGGGDAPPQVPAHPQQITHSKLASHAPQPHNTSLDPPRKSPPGLPSA